MSRELKFRAWHKEAHRMLYEEVTGYALKWLAEGQPVEIMQWTGLYDLTYKEIYEGDILMVKAPPSIGAMEVVVYRDGAFLVEIISAGIMRTQHLSDRISWGATCVRDEVIGNIYANPELLEGQYD